MNTSRRTLSAGVADSIRDMLAAGRVPSGTYLPAERELVRRHGVSRVTVRRALRQLVGEGLIESVPYQGYRPVAPEKSETSRGAMAYVLASAGPEESWDLTHEQIISAFNRALFERGRRATALGVRGREAGDIFRELKEAGVWGVALDTSHDEFIRAAAAGSLPCVVVDAYDDAAGLDVVIQDNFNGARLATGYLTGRGHERIGWVGPARGLAHYRERFAGARSALSEVDRDFEPGLIVETSANDAWDQAAEPVRRMLARRDRPTALVCMWLEMALGTARAVREAGLRVGEDVEIAAWATEREYREVLAPEFLGGEVPATMVWRPGDMAALALERLERRAADPGTPAARLDVAVRLVEPRKAEDVVRGGARSGKKEKRGRS